VNNFDELWPERRYAKYRGVSPRTAQRERETGAGCPFIKIGRTVRYRQRDVIEFIERHLRRSTSESP
jgi:hypothetical protein